MYYSVLFKENVYDEEKSLRETKQYASAVYMGKMLRTQVMVSQLSD